MNLIQKFCFPLLMILTVVFTTTANSQTLTPAVTSINPQSVFAGSGAVALTVYGSGFDSSSTVYVQTGGSSGTPALPTVLVDPNTLQATISANLLATTTTLTVIVKNIEAGRPIFSAGGALFSVYSMSPPVVTAALNPAGGIRGTTTPVTITGQNLVGATLSFNGSGMSTGGPENFDIAVDTNAALGPQSVTISTPSGTTTTCGSNPCMFTAIDSGTWTTLATPQLNGPAVKLPDGRIFVAGGSGPSEILDPTQNTWTSAAAMNTPRSGPVAVVLADGRVLAAGGTSGTGTGSVDLFSAEIYDPVTNTWSATGSLAAVESSQALLMQNGEVLVVHGPGHKYEIFNPSTGQFSQGPIVTPSSKAPASSVATLMSDGRVLLVDEAIYDPVSGIVTPVPQAFVAFSELSAQPLPDGRVLEIGILPPFQKTALIYDPRVNAYSPVSVAEEVQPLLLANGIVLLVGNGFSIVTDLSYYSALLYDPVRDLIFPQTTYNPGFAPSILFNDGRAIAFGTGIGSSTIYTPVPFTNPAPSITTVQSSPAVSNAGNVRLDIYGSSFAPTTSVSLGSTKLETLYLSSTRLVAFVPPALQASINSGIVLNTPGPGGGKTLPLRPGAIASAPLPISDVETGAIRTGYVIVTPDTNSTAPVSTLTYGMVQNAVVLSQGALLPTGAVTDTSLPVDVVTAASRNLGVAIANVNSAPASIAFVLRDDTGTIVSTTPLALPPHSQIAKFVSEIFSSNVVGAAFQGSLEIQSSVPVSVIGLRFSGAAFSTVPVPGGAPVSGPIVFPQFAMSGGWATTLSLLNNTTGSISGRIDIFDAAGNPMPVQLNGVQASSFTYAIPANGSMLFAPRDVNGQSPF